MNCPYTTQSLGAVLHGGQTVSAGVQFGLKAPAIILHAKLRVPGFEQQLDSHLARLRVFYYVRKSFLADAEQLFSTLVEAAGRFRQAKVERLSHCLQ